MLHCVDLGNVEVCLDLLLDKLVLVCVKAVPCVFKLLKGTVGVGLKVSIVDKVENGASCSYDFWVSCISNDTKKNFLHVLVLVSSPLRDERYTLLEMTKTRVSSHRLKTPVDLTFPTSKRAGDPLD